VTANRKGACSDGMHYLPAIGDWCEHESLAVTTGEVGAMIRSVPDNVPRARGGRFALVAVLVALAAMILMVWSPPAARAATNGVANPSFETAGSSAADAVNWTEGINHARSS